jgi:4-hydroxy-2-oxoheptanedioate aldolase
MLRENALKAKLAAKEPCLGAFINFPSPHAVEVCGIAGLDFIVLDAEHGPMGPQSCEEMVRAASLVDITPIVRVSQNHPQVVLRYLDIGALGVQIPMLNTAEDAERAAVSVKYHPEGRRGLAGTRAASYGLGPALSEYVVEANKQTMLIAQIETIQAVEALPQILKVDNIDVVFIGPSDLSQSMGFPGLPGEPAVQQVIDRCIAQILEAGKPVGTVCRDGAHAKQLIDRGVTYLLAAVVALLAQSVRNYVATARGG